MTLEALVALIPPAMLVCCRTGGLVVTAPVLGGAQVPPVIRTGVALGLAAAILPVVPFDPSAIPLDLLGWTTAAARELLVGVAMGFAASLVLLGLQLAGEVIDVQMGFMMAGVTDPSTNTTVPLMGQFLYLLGILAFLALRGHHWLLRAIAESYQVVPLAGATLRGGMWEQGNSMVAEVFASSLAFGAPVVAALMLTELSMGIVGRAVPQMNILMLGFAVRIAVGFAVVWFVLAAVFDVLANALGPQGLFSELFTLARGMGPTPTP